MNASRITFYLVVSALASFCGCGAPTSGTSAKSLASRTRWKPIIRPEIARKDFWDMWCALRYQPIIGQARGRTPVYFLSAKGRQWYGRPRVERIGHYWLATVNPQIRNPNGNQAALLFDLKGQPLWAGEFAVPLRKAGKPHALLLGTALESERLETYFMRYEVAVWDCSSPSGRLQELGSLFPRAFAEVSPEGLRHEDIRHGQLQYDIDGDGSDEFALADLTHAYALDSMQWYLRVYSFVGSVHEPRAGVGGTGELVVRSVVTVPLQRSVIFVSLHIVSEPVRGIKVLVDLSERDKAHELGLICRDAASGSWSFVPRKKDSAPGGEDS